VIGERGALHLWRLRGEKSRLDEQNYRLQKENDALRKRIARFRDDDRYLEKLAREELNLVRPGEVVYRFPKADPRPERKSAVSDAPFESRPSKEQKSPR
jgi:cell division protein FtsB